MATGWAERWAKKRQQADAEIKDFLIVINYSMDG
jgi:hypothetical protein